ncbi:2-oxoglutarate (2OG) and Fe(II)-dependent oxygenase superfamily protein [Striga asiatica]|uniref:2-oxoglutarate (2OG) and Fe(II)-dependent oxygenase superfamily protein n=1 Tax=Striga asiatica TaxID=4170 RepID=A0A5A7RAG6_STRAF|nr:2-oxoglutarate (2OG) and Fe(II)-dependent oxygenase superfamily protein [Striga asiatica]
MSVLYHSEPEDLIDFLVHNGNGVKGLSQLNLKQIPSQFIQPPDQRLSHIQVSTQKSIPTIDVSQWADTKTAQSICEAAKTWGFFQIVNHGIPPEVMENVKRASHDFFGLPVEERRKYLKENSPTQSVMLKTSFSPLAEKVLEWKDYLVHLVGPEIDDADFALWPSVTSGVLQPSAKLLIGGDELQFAMFSSVVFFKLRVLSSTINRLYCIYRSLQLQDYSFQCNLVLIMVKLSK